MATSLMSHPCGERCDEEAEYKVSFVVTSLEMSDKEAYLMFEDVLIAITWDGNVVKLMSNRPEAEEFKEEMDLVIHATPKRLSEKLKSSPIMFDLSRGCTELGTIKLEIKDCFSDAVLCNDFNSQSVSNTFKFVKDDQENAIMNAYFFVQKLLNDGITGNLFKELERKKTERTKMRKRAAEALAGKPIDECESDENDPCEDFVCPDELAEHCKRDLGLNQNIYRIVNGILINTKDQIGPCGEKCPVASKYIKELCKRPSEMVPLSSRFKFKHNESKCTQLFDNPCECKSQKTNEVNCPQCGGTVRGKSCSKSFKACKDDWIDRNIREEDLLHKLCDKYGVNIDDVRGVVQQIDPKSCKNDKKKRKKKSKCVKKIVSPSTNNITKCVEKQPDRKAFIKEMKRKARGTYSYDFGNNYPLRRVCSNTEVGAGDCVNVPRYMGWRWDSDLGIGCRKWYPGQINKTVRCLMKNFLNPFPYDTLPITRRDESGRIIKTCNDYLKQPEFNPAFLQRPTLLIQKRDGEYSITMNPLKDKKKLETDVNPYLNSMPLEFKIKRNPEDIKKHRAKKLLRAHGFQKKCPCLDLICCRCMSDNAKKLLRYEMKNISKKMELQHPLEFAELDDSSDSELEMEFVTPSALINTRKYKPDVVHCGTQYGLKDFVPPKIKKEEEMPKKTKCLKPSKSPKAPKMIPKPKRRIESIYVDPPCPPVVTCEPTCITIHPPRCC